MQIATFCINICNVRMNDVGDITTGEIVKIWGWYNNIKHLHKTSRYYTS